MFRDYAARFQPYQSLLNEWMASEILPREKLGLRPRTVGRSITPGATPAAPFKIQWAGPNPQIATECLVGICRGVPASDADPSVALHRITMTGKTMELGGGSLPLRLKPEWVGCYAVVWACVDLGFRKFYSEPLVLGRLEHGSNGRNGRG
jgi:hypothetical protein